MIRRANVSRKLSVVIVPVIISLAVVLVVMFLSLLQSSNEKELQRLLASRSDVALRQFNHTYEQSMSNARMIFSQEDMAHIFDDTYGLSARSIQSLRARFNDLRQTEKSYKQVYVINSFGNVIYFDNGKSFYDISLTQRLSGYALQANSRDEKGTPEAHLLAHEGGWIWVMSLPVKYQQQLGYIIVVLDAAVIRQAMEKMDNVFVDFRGAEDDALLSPMHKAIIKQRHSGDTQQEIEFEGGHYRYNYTDTPYGTLYSWVDQDMLAFSNSGAIFKLILISVFLTMLVLGWVWFGLHRLVIMPIKRVAIALEGVINNSFTESELDSNTTEFERIRHAVQQVNANLQHHSTHIEQLAYYDDLTKLHNKQYMVSFLDSYLEEDLTLGNKLHAWVIDIKGFKRINSTHGHDIGDDVLCSVGARIRASKENFARRHGIEESQILVSRGASDEFVVMGIVDYKGDICEPLAQSIKDAIEAPLTVGGHSFSLHVAIGFAKGAEDPAEIYQNADIARHEAKEKGASILRYTETLKKRTLKNQAMVDDICRALELNEFTLHYQPKLNLSSGKVTAFEALIRWPHGSGFISPGIFIPFAETAGLIADIDMYVMRKLINDISVLQTLGWSEFSVSFNISALRLMDAQFMNAMKQTMFESKVRPEHIQIEITEHSLMDNITESIEAIEHLKAMGVSVALDDFGTGHSSLAYLKDLPIDVLKIDRTFIHNVHNEDQKKVLLSHIVKIGQSLSMSIVAEGVETEQEYNIINELGCEELQGYFFHKPMPLPSMIESFGDDKGHNKDMKKDD